MVSREWIQEMRIKWGEESNPYRIHVLGEFPSADDDTVIPMHLTILGCAFLGAGGGVLLFGALKTVADVAMHKTEHRLLQGHSGAASR